MKSLEESVTLDAEKLWERVGGLELDGESGISKNEVREKLSEHGFNIKKIRVGEPREFSMLACDASILKRELLYNCLWTAHAVCVRAVFDGEKHPDVLSGRGGLPYRDLSYENAITLDSFKPYSALDERLDSVRVALECGMLAKSHTRQDLLLFDGSLKTSLEKVSKRRGYPEHEDAKTALANLLEKPVVAMVEDTHSSEVSKKVGFTTTDLLLFEIGLNEAEYVEYGEEVKVRYIKLPAKHVEHLGGGKSQPLTVRWEFNEKSEKHFQGLVNAWIMEDDILHPQAYPLRAADFLTRKIRVSGILDEIVREKNLKQKRREERTA